METEVQLSIEARELALYAENTASIYNGYVLPLLKVCQKKYLAGQGDYEKLLKGFTRVGGEVARRYHLEHGSMSSKWSDVFPVSVRREFARYMAEGFLAEYHLGNRF